MMNPLDALNTIVHLNNDAVRCMRENRFDVAVHMLTQGVQIIQQANNNDNDVDWDDGEPRNAGDDCGCLGPMIAVPLPLLKEQNLTGYHSACGRTREDMAATMNDNNDGFGIYQNAHVLTLKRSDQNANIAKTGTDLLLSLRDKLRASSVLLYNVALAFHCQGLVALLQVHCDGEATLLLQKALRIYEMVHPLFFSEDQSAASSAAVRAAPPEPPCLLRLNLALWNNMGHIHHHFMHRRDTVRCCRVLRNLLCTGGCSTALPADEVLFFVFNALLLDATAAQPAPAA